MGDNSTWNATSPVTGQSSLKGASIGLAVLATAFLLGCPGNAFVVWSAGCRVRKRTVTCLLILHLAIADLIVLFTAPVFLRVLSVKEWELGDVVCRICHYICGVSMYASVFLIALMSLDRCLAVSKPILSHKIRSKKTIRLVVLGVWMAGFLLAIPVLIYRQVSEKKGEKPRCDFNHPTPRHLVFHNLFETITGFLLPFVTIIYCYCTIGQRLRDTRFRQKRRTSRLIALIVVAFAVFWLPYHVVNLLDVAAVWSGSTGVEDIGKAARRVLVALAFFSSSVNPILYAFSGGSLIRSAGLGFMAKLFEGTASEISSIKHGTTRDPQRHMETKVDPAGNGSPADLTESTNPTGETYEEHAEVLKALNSP
ncbi:leukotriene B4 receptor 1 [Sphaerodactylus townsendi]|uniref:leukotriene B4 receptor 1 n=1 Tax=Sphaerodactylus townsendi TaxID=933632 RepID=UPI002026BBCB|nr:leukotriene B4 receptor 1 [Sphaerodactylus townsendi]XP_048373803.1 leukotriene B4 receptor 1 [Sphaerodactylus townsendi]